MKVGIIGCGTVSQYGHIPTLANMPGVELVALSDVNVERLEGLKQKPAIINAIEAKTGLGRTQIATMMDSETWFSAGRAVELKFADKILYSEPPPQATDFMFDRVTVMNAFLRKLPGEGSKGKGAADSIKGVPYTQLVKRLELIK